MTIQEIGLSLDTVWMLLAAMLVFFMQPGFALCEAGFTRSKNTANILFKNFVDFMLGSVLFWLIGFGLMFGSDGAGFAGMPNFGDLSFYKSDLPTEGFLMFETVFCATSLRYAYLSSTIVKEVAHYDNTDISKFVNPYVAARLKEKLGR